MLEGLSELTSYWLQSRPWLAAAAVFLGGVTTAANPCSLAAVPVLIGLTGGHAAVTDWRRGLLTSLVFVAGLAASFSAMAVAAVSAGTYFGAAGPFWPWVLAAVCLLAAAQFWDLWHLSLPGLSNRLGRVRPARSGLGAAFGMGLLFGVLSAPCAAPVLAVVLAYVASKASLGYGLLLVWLYAVGHCALLVVAGTSVGAVRRLVASERYARANLWFRRAAGALLAAVGLYLIVNQLPPAG
ncbi:MAG: cytochrome c biogenesis protein CcdA [Deferrisomatales bacterium]|nr:cytochrome c biogenesis protein CcdA [Deferrisomatales bacterium]